MTKKSGKGAPSGKPRKPKATSAAAVVLIAAVLIYLAAGLKANGASGAGSASSSAPEGSGAGSAASETPAEAGRGSSSKAAEASALSEPSSGGESSSGDGYVLPPSESQNSSQAASREGNSDIRESVRQIAPGGAKDRLSSSGVGAKADDSSGSKISREEYDSLKKGMTYEEAEAAVGGPGTPQAGSDGGLRIYKWPGAGSPDSYAQLTFRDDRLTFKIQFGL